MLARFHQTRPEVKIVLHNLTKDRQLQALGIDGYLNQGKGER